MAELPRLGRLQPVDLRSLWADEARAFTPWLADPDNLRLLGEALGMDLELVRTESEVGSFFANIVCRDTADGSHVLIENQLEQRNACSRARIGASGSSASREVVSQSVRESRRPPILWAGEGEQVIAWQCHRVGFTSNGRI